MTFRRSSVANVLWLLYGLLSAHGALAQTFRLMRYDEEYAYVPKDTLSGQAALPHFYHRLKFIPLAANKKVYLSVGGEVRLEYAVFHHEDWGQTGIGWNRFLLQRYALHTDLHLGSRIRVFAQLRSALEDGRKDGPRSIDEDQLNIQNMFVEVKLLTQAASCLTIRAGRQELEYGSGRLLSVREGPNVRLYFTGGKAMYAYRNLSIDGFVMVADTLHLGVFDNKVRKEINLWGFYSRWNVQQNQYLEGYYLGIRRNQGAFEAGVENEVRHTVGCRWARSGKGLNYNVETAYQFGRFGNGPINAWTASFDLGYRFTAVRLSPMLGIRHDYISGDHRPKDNSLQTFNPLYPKGGYFGFQPLVGPANLVDVHPYGSLQLNKFLVFQWDAVFNWRFCLQDGLYKPSGTYHLEGAGSSERYIGTACMGTFTYVRNGFISMDLGIQIFQPGAFIRSKIPDSRTALLTNTRIAFKF